MSIDYEKMLQKDREERIKLSKKLIKEFKPLLKETIYEKYLDSVFCEKRSFDRKFSNFHNGSYIVVEIDKLLKDTQKEEILPIIKDLTYSSLPIKSFEDFMELTKVADKFSLIKNVVMNFKGKLVPSTLNYSTYYSSDIDKSVSEIIEEKIIRKENVYTLDKEVEDYYEKILFFKNLELYIKGGKFGDQLRQLCSSVIETRGKYNENDSPLADFKSILQMENKESFFKAMSEKISDYIIGTTKPNILILKENEYNYFAKNEQNIIYQFTVVKKTNKNYLIKRDKLIYSKLSPKTDRYMNNFTDFFKPLVINKEYIELDIGDKVLIIGSDTYSSYFAVKSDIFLEKCINYIEVNKKINLCTKQDIEKIRDYFIQVLSKKNSNDFGSLNEERKLKIKELEDQYYSISMPTHEDLLNICKKIDLNTEYIAARMARNYEILERFLELKEREKIGSKLREIRELQDNSKETLKTANKLTSIDSSLNKRQKEGAEAIFNKYYSEESKRIEFKFPFERNYDLNEKSALDEQEEINKKIEILKTTCVKSDFDFS